MDSVQKTLYIPLYGKAWVSRRGILLHDPAAEAIWDREGFSLHGKAKSKWLAYYMGMRAAVYDRWLSEQMEATPKAVVIQLGCGLDSRIQRLGCPKGRLWYDLDLPEVIREWRRYFAESDGYHMLGADARDSRWLQNVPADESALVVMEGVSMYFRQDELLKLLTSLARHFSSVKLLMDCYTVFAARASKYKNPIQEVGVTQLYGIDRPETLESGTGLRFTAEKELTPDWLINQLTGFDHIFFRVVFTGAPAKKSTGCLNMKNIKKEADAFASASFIISNQPFTMEAISAAKFSCFFSMPSPFSKRTASLKVTVPPSALAAEAIYFSTVRVLSLTNSCCSRQFSA